VHADRSTARPGPARGRPARGAAALASGPIACPPLTCVVLRALCAPQTLFSFRPPLEDIRCDEMYEQFYENAQVTLCRRPARGWRTRVRQQARARSAQCAGCSVRVPLWAGSWALSGQAVSVHTLAIVPCKCRTLAMQDAPWVPTRCPHAARST
jgi:hypothetical protein